MAYRGGSGMPFDSFFGGAFGGAGNPFQMMNQVMDQMHAQMNRAFSDPFFADAGFMAPDFMATPQAAPARHHALPAATIEEVPHDYDDAYPRAAGTQPTVEEPDEEDDRPQQQPQYYQQQSQQQPQFAQQQQRAMSFPSMPAFPAGGYMFSSSSTTYSNSNGVQYHKSSTARIGPGDVKEVRVQERDSRIGQEKITVARGLGEKAKIMTRTRNASGQEHAQNVLRGLDADDAHRFDDEWISAAERSGLGRFGGQVQQPYQPQLGRLPSSTSHDRSRRIPSDDRSNRPRIA